MVDICNNISSVEELAASFDKIVLYGAGSSCKLFLKSFWDILCDKVVCVVDGNPNLDGKRIENNGTDIEIIGLRRFIRTYNDNIKDMVLLLTPVASSRIIAKLDEVSELDGVKVFLLPMISNNYKVDSFGLKNEKKQFIPKKIHYIWIGGNELPLEYRKNIETWKKYCPDYEIICWNETNYDFKKNNYMKEAYEKGRSFLMYATDYARKDILYSQGGIYLDTDVELLKPFDDLLFNHAFIGIEDNGQVNSGSALGSEAGHPMMKALMDCYENEHFLDEDGNPKIVYNTFYETKCLIEHGYKMINKLQMVDGLTCFPREVFMPINFAGMEDFFTDNTVSVHKINPEDHLMHKEAYETWKHRIV